MKVIEISDNSNDESSSDTIFKIIIKRVKRKSSKLNPDKKAKIAKEKEQIEDLSEIIDNNTPEVSNKEETDIQHDKIKPKIKKVINKKVKITNKIVDSANSIIPSARKAAKNKKIKEKVVVPIPAVFSSDQETDSDSSDNILHNFEPKKVIKQEPKEIKPDSSTDSDESESTTYDEEELSEGTNDSPVPVLIGNLNSNVSEDQLKSFFSENGVTLTQVELKNCSAKAVVMPGMLPAALRLIGRLFCKKRISIMATNEQIEVEKEEAISIFVKYMSTDTTRESLHAAYPDSISATIICNPETGNSKGYGFVNFSTRREANNAIKSIKQVDGRIISSCFAKTSKPIALPKFSTSQETTSQTDNRNNHRTTFLD